MGGGWLNIGALEKEKKNFRHQHPCSKRAGFWGKGGGGWC